MSGTLGQVQEAEIVLGALQQLQDAVLATSMAEAGNQDVGNKLSQLSVHLQALLQRHAVFEQSCSDRAAVEKALRNVINSKEAEAARLRSEIIRLRHHLQLAADTQQQQQSNASVQEADTPSDPASRQAVLAAAVAAKDKPLAVVAQLESEVSACHVRIDVLESELAAAAMDNSNRLAEQQKAFFTKLEQLRQVHGQQLAAASQAAQVAEQQHTQALPGLQQQLHHAEVQEQKLQGLVTSLDQQVQQLQCQVKSSRTLEADHSSNDRQAVQRSTNGTQVAGGVEYVTATASTPSVGLGVGADTPALQIMEEQLARLSSIIKAHQSEIVQLRQTVVEGYTERQVLQQQLQKEQGVQQQQLDRSGAVKDVRLGASAGRSISARTKPNSDGSRQVRSTKS